MSWRAWAICSADRAGDGPNRTPRAFAAIRPARELIQGWQGQKRLPAGVAMFLGTLPAIGGIRAPIYEEKVVDFLLELAQVTEKKVSREELFKDDETAAEK